MASILSRPQCVKSIDICALICPVCYNKILSLPAVSTDDVITWKQIPHYWLNLRGNPGHHWWILLPKGQWCGPLMCPLMPTWICCRKRIVWLVIWDNKTLMWHHCNMHCTQQTGQCSAFYTLYAWVPYNHCLGAALVQLFGIIRKHNIITITII